ncbi:AraC family transcriptional regulator [Nocardia carnea]|uniref:AraC family transcriptional regulator n=1 Tax=Nocardia carnea TaxID=37328 RepID=UPI00245493A2|nr:AraC family transcriptional regulator [Nocardia carnea]
MRQLGPAESGLHTIGREVRWIRERYQPFRVDDLAHRVGYHGPSQFSREYRRLFGTTPSRAAALPQSISE